MSVTIIPVVKAASSVLGGLFFADFVSGVVHWFEDRYGNPKWPILGHTIQANQEHHFKPRAFLAGSFFSRNKEVLAIGSLFLLGFWAAGWLNLFTLSAVSFGMFANEFHRAAHRSPQENGRIISFFQKTGLAQSFQHHANHHRKGKDSHFCVMTNYVNPVLERIKFFPAIEQTIRFISGKLPRFDASVNIKYQPRYYKKLAMAG